MSVRFIALITALATIAGCERSDLDPAERLALARPHLAAAATAAAEIAAGRRRCDLTIPGYPGCEVDRRQVLILARPLEEDRGAGTRWDGLLYVPNGQRPILALTLWRFDSLGAPLGHGWYQVIAISNVD